MMQNSKLAVVFGGSGFVGRHTVRALARSGWRVRVAVRRPDLAGHLQPMGGVGQIHAVQANVRYPESLAQAVEGADAVVNLVAILFKSGAQTFEKVHVDGSRAVARAAAAEGIKTFVHVSAIGAGPKSPGAYGQTKAQGEAGVQAEVPSATILRPSVIFGPEDQFLNRFAGMAASPAPFLPLVGGGRTKFQPVYVGDVAQAIVTCLENPTTAGQIYELGGPDVMTFRQILDRVKEWSGRKKRYAPLPFWAAKIAAAMTAPLPNAMRPLTVDQVRMLTVDNVVSAEAKAAGRTLEGLGITPQTMAAIVPSYLERFQPRGQYAHYRT
ncbi:MAG: hypothetical protein RL291_1488 [Pseudomonadota bacterium]